MLHQKDVGLGRLLRMPMRGAPVGVPVGRLQWVWANGLGVFFGGVDFMGLGCSSSVFDGGFRGFMVFAQSPGPLGYYGHLCFWFCHCWRLAALLTMAYQALVSLKHSQLCTRSRLARATVQQCLVKDNLEFS